MAKTALNEYRFGGHQTFALRIAWLPKAAAAIAAGEDPLSNPLNGVVSLGLGKNMVEALRCWIEAFGVAFREGKDWELTAFGRSIFGSHGFDPYLEDEQTLWLLHWNIATLRKAPFFAWELLLNRWNEPTFSASAVLSAFATEAKRSERPLSPVSMKQHFEVWLHTYLVARSGRNEDGLDSPLAALRLVRHSGSKEASNGRMEPLYTFDLERKLTLSQALFEYCVHDWWDMEFEHEETIPLSEITFGRMSPGRIFRMPEAEVRERIAVLSEDCDASLELMESLNQLIVRRRSKPERHRLLAMVYRIPKPSMEVADA